MVARMTKKKKRTVHKKSGNNKFKASPRGNQANGTGNAGHGANSRDIEAAAEEAVRQIVKRFGRSVGTLSR